MSRPRAWIEWAGGLLILLLCPLSLLAAPVLEDDTGRRHALSAPAQRIVTLAPFLTELAYAAGAGERLVGAVAFSDHPPAATRLPQVGDFRRLDLEALLALQPDLVLAWDSGNPAAQLERLRDLGLPVFVVEPHALEDIARLLEQIGQLAGTSEQAGVAARVFRTRLQTLRARYSARRPVSVFYQIWHRPLMTVNGEHVISAVIRLCGGRNVFADLPALAGEVGLEAVLAADPEAIVASDVPEQDRPGWLDHWQQWPRLRAVRNGHLFRIDPDLIQRHSPRILEGAQRMCERLELVRQNQE